MDSWIPPLIYGFPSFHLQATIILHLQQWTWSTICSHNCSYPSFTRPWSPNKTIIMNLLFLFSYKFTKMVIVELKHKAKALRKCKACSNLEVKWSTMRSGSGPKTLECNSRSGRSLELKKLDKSNKYMHQAVYGTIKIIGNNYNAMHTFHITDDYNCLKKNTNEFSVLHWLNERWKPSYKHLHTSRVNPLNKYGIDWHTHYSEIRYKALNNLKSNDFINAYVKLLIDILFFWHLLWKKLYKVG